MKFVCLPDVGSALICSDLHGHEPDFSSLLEKTQFESRCRAGEQLYLIITGDVPDTTRHRYFHPEVPIDGDAAIFERLLELKRQFPERLIYLEGNHDFHLVRIYEDILTWLAEQNIDQPWLNDHRCLRQDLINDFMDHYQQTYGHHLYQVNIAPYDMIPRLTPDHISFIRSSAIVAHLPKAQALVFHAGPIRKQDQSPQALAKQIDQLDRQQLRLIESDRYYNSIYHQLLNNRFRNDDYQLEDIDAFCQHFNAKLLITGHTPLAYLQNQDPNPDQRPDQCQVKNHLGWVGPHQAVLCTSFGALSSDTKVYLEIDLAKPLSGVADLSLGQEIQLLNKP